jgi:hypothetical protein
VATKTKYNTENLRVEVGGKEHLVKKGQYAKQIANELAISLETDFKQSNILDLIGLVEQGKGLNADNPEVWHKAYERVKSDMDRTMDILAEQEADKQAKEKADKEAAENKEKAELALVDSVATLDVSRSFADLSEKFDLGSDLNQCRLKEGVEVDDAEMLGYFVTAMKMGDFSNWAKGDLIVQLEDRGHERAMQEYCQRTGTPYQTVYRMAVTARAVPPEKRVKGVSFTAYQEVATARLDKDEKANSTKRDALIERVGKGVGEKVDGAEFKNVQDIRAAVREAAGKEPPAPKDPDAVDREKDTFIVVNWAERNTYKMTGLIEEYMTDNDVEILHAKTARRMNDTKGARWGKLEELKATPPPEPVKEEVPTHNLKGVPQANGKKGGDKKKK